MNDEPNGNVEGVIPDAINDKPKVVAEIERRYQRLINKAKQDPDLDELEKQYNVEALESTMNAKIRAEMAKVDRARKDIYLAHFAHGCPECGHKFAIPQEQVSALLLLRSKGGVRI